MGENNKRLSQSFFEAASFISIILILNNRAATVLLALHNQPEHRKDVFPKK